MKKKPLVAKRYSLRRSVGVPAEVAGAELERIAHAHGGITPRTVVDEARPKGAPLHPAFEWDNSKAAEAYRIEQARSLIRSVHIVEEGADAGAAFYHVAAVSDEGEEREMSYQPIARILSDQQLVAGAIRTLRLNLEAAARSLSDLERKVRNARKSKKILNAGRAVKRAVDHLHGV